MAALGVAAIRVPAPATATGSPAPAPCRRIVSLSPNITEILFAVGLGDRVVGVTRFCDFPPEAARLPRVGGYFDTNVEAVVSLEPDLVVMLPVHGEIGEVLDRVGIERLTVGNETIEEILSSITSIGERCGAADSAAALRASIERGIDRIRSLTADGPRPSVLFVVSRTYTASPVDVCAAARGTFYDELIEAAGGRNVLESRAPAYPGLSMEGMLHLDPESIVEIVPSVDDRRLDRGLIEDGWKSAPELRAVREGRVTIIAGDYAAIPGPRLLLLLEEIAAALHPGLYPSRRTPAGDTLRTGTTRTR